MHFLLIRCGLPLHFFVDFKEWATPHYVLLLILRSGLPLLLICQIDPGLNLLYKKWHKTCYTLSITYSIDKSGSPLLGTISVGHTVHTYLVTNRLTSIRKAKLYIPSTINI
jgi:hypothetical protein